MNDLVEFLTSQELIVVYIVVGVVFILGLIIYLVDKSYYNRRKKQNTKELFRLVDQIEDRISEENLPNEKQVEEVKEEAPTNILYVENETEKENIKPAQVVKEEKTIAEEIKPPVIKVEEPEIKPAPVQVKQEPISKTLAVPDTKVEDLILDNMEVENKTEKLPRVEEIKYTTAEPNKEEAQAELKRLTEELQKAEQLQQKKMENKKATLEELEDDQEENAIISLDELIKKSQDRQYDSDVERYEEDDENKPISIAELEKLKIEIDKLTENNKSEKTEITSIEELNIPELALIEDKKPYQEKMVLDEFNNIKLENETPKVPVYNENNKFKNSPVISPVFGIEQKQMSETDFELENTANYEKLDEEIKKTNEFLMTLKELQKKLN